MKFDVTWFVSLEKGNEKLNDGIKNQIKCCYSAIKYCLRLFHFQENELEMDRESIGGRTRGSSIWLKNDDDEDMMDLLDRNKILKNIATTRSDVLKEKKWDSREMISSFTSYLFVGHSVGLFTNSSFNLLNIFSLKFLWCFRLQEVNDNDNDKCSSDFKVVKDGRLIIENLDIDQQDKRKRRQLAKSLDMPNKKMKRDSDSKSDSDSDYDNSRVCAFFVICHVLFL